MENSASSKPPVPFYAVIVAAGSGQRFGGELPKQYQKIGDKAILRHTLETFLGCPGLQRLCVVINPEHRALYDDALSGLDLPEPIAGGSDRKASVYNGLINFSDLPSDAIILIHDAARPLVTGAEIENLAEATAMQQAATLAAPVADTLKYPKNGYVDRNDLWAIQTPQGFHYGLLLRAHEQANPEIAVTDDTGLVAALGHDIAFVPGSRRNFKITTPEDMEMAQSLLAPAKNYYETRTGFGYDVHAFTEGDNVRLCGIDIPHNKKLKGHSDADAGLHALTDALLGTIGAGDIGHYFPPSDPQWKDAESALFLEQAVALVKDKGGKINNLDLTLICEEPKIGPHRDAMQKRIANICGLKAERVGIKATTNEKLGFLGRGEGIAAQAVATVRFLCND